MSHADMQHFENGQMIQFRVGRRWVEGCYIGLDRYTDGSPFGAHVVIETATNIVDSQYLSILDKHIRPVPDEVPDSPDPLTEITARLAGIEARLTALEPPQLSRDEMSNLIADCLCRRAKPGFHTSLANAGRRLLDPDIEMTCDTYPCGSEECAATLLFAAEVLGIHHEWEPV